jgi:poly-gamma-glutamate capsule biosynthesis protein CapA/YwtB (metallophosphatase superfamily)
MEFSGDVLIHRPIVARALANGGGATYDFVPMFARIAPLVSSVDLGVCHFETPVAPPGEELSGHPIYGIPREIAPALAKAGFDRCSTASNHTLDRGMKGIDATVDTLEAAGIASSGMARTPEESEPHVFTVNGIRFSQLAYTWGFNGLIMPKGQEWRAKLLDADRIIADAQTARARGAEYVFVNFHWGQERSWKITDEQHALAQAVTASGAVDLIVGEHVHVLQPIEQVNGRWVIYGMSNLISNLPGGDVGWPASSQDGAVFTLTVTRHPGGGFDTSRPVVHPTWVDHDGYLIRLVLDDLADPSTPPGVAAELRRSLERTRQVLGDYLPTA